MTLATWAMLLALFQTPPSPTLFADYAATLRVREAAQTEPQVQPVLNSTADCYIAANRLPGEGIFQCGARFYAAEAARSRTTPTRAGAGPSSAPPELPPEALRDPYGYVLSQCSPLVLPRDQDPAACEYRLWSAIRAVRPSAGGPRPASSTVAEPATTAVAEAEGRPSGGRCRTVSRPAAAGVGGSFARVCGDPAEADRLLEDTEARLRAVVTDPCDRPAQGESQSAWIARCQALPPR